MLFLKNYCQFKSFFSEMQLVPFGHWYSEKLTSTKDDVDLQKFLYMSILYAYIFMVTYVLFNPLFLKNTKASWKYFCPLGTWRVIWGSNIEKGKARKWSIKLLSLVHGGAQNQKFSANLCKVLYLFTFYLTFSFTQSSKNWLARNI